MSHAKGVCFAIRRLEGQLKDAFVWYLQEIVDETDRYIDNLRLQRVNAALLTSSLPKHLRK